MKFRMYPTVPINVLDTLPLSNLRKGSFFIFSRYVEISYPSSLPSFLILDEFHSTGNANISSYTIRNRILVLLEISFIAGKWRYFEEICGNEEFFVEELHGYWEENLAIAKVINWKKLD